MISRVGVVCRSPQGERGLKLFRDGIGRLNPGRSPQGERGLKFRPVQLRPGGHQSLSARRAWIEIRIWGTGGDHGAGRSPQGERGLKSEEGLVLTPGKLVALRKESVD